jgi:Holliday junction resolvasome RuvABC endonuclease subunit
VLEFCFDERDVTHVFVEGYAFAAQSSSVTKLAELGGVVRVALHERGIDAVSVPSTSCRKLLLGKVPRNGAKVAVQQAVYAVGAPFDNDDQVDAYCVANWGLSELGYTAMTLTETSERRTVVSQ